MKSLYQILVPAASNDGLEFSIEHHQEWDRKVQEITGGLTILKSAKGYWLSPTKESYVEKMIPVQVQCTRQEIEQIATYTAAHYQQKAIMFAKISDEVEIMHF